MRYADSKGLGLDRRRTAWPYRDWVVRAFNDDLPFDEFTIKQLAGDLLPDADIEDRLATAAHRQTQTNEEGGTDDEEFRVAAAIDRVSTTWQVWQGLTMGCVQCHDHPYDPPRPRGVLRGPRPVQLHRRRGFGQRIPHPRRPPATTPIIEPPRHWTRKSPRSNAGSGRPGMSC